ncbi:MAG: glycosyltransferase family 4 protein [Acidobacteria bacterium]|nr:glycosyltransferase family 4 protein [Acidobacteriota bacterium]
MVIALDGTPLTVSTGGIRRYTEELAHALAVEFPGDAIHLVSDQKLRVSFAPPCNLAVHSCAAANLAMRRWWAIGLPLVLRRLGAHIFHGTDFAVPYLPLGPAVMTVHDLSPWRDPRWHHAAGRVRRRTPFLLGLGLATCVITPSEAVRKEAIEFFRIHPDRAYVVPEAASSLFRPVNGRLFAGEYFLYLGPLEPRKNLETLVAAFRVLRTRHDVKLLLAGRERPDFPGIAPEPGIELSGEVADADLPALYSGAVACVYPSLYEGFGLPVVEAMQCGAAVVASRDPALIEVSGGAAIHVDARDVNGWVEAMEALLTRPELVALCRTLSLQRAGQFSWSRTAQKTREVYTAAIRRFRG